MWRKALTIGMAVILGLGAFGWWYIKSQSFMVSAANLISAEATKALQTEVKIDQIEVRSLTGITAGKITVYDKTGAPIASADSVDIQFNPWSMAKGAPGIEAVRGVTVNRAEIHLEKRDSGDWNYADLISSDQEPSNDFRAKVTLKDATARVSADGKNLALERVNGDLDFSSMPAIAYALSFANQGATAEASGVWGGARQAVSVKAKSFQLENYLEFLPRELAVKLKTGELKSLDVTLLEKGGAYEIEGEALVLGVGIEVEGTSVDGLDGLVLFNERQLRVFSRGQVNGQPIVLRGTSSLDLVDPTLDLSVSSKGFDASKVLKTFPVQGDIAFQAHIGGKFSNPVVEGEFEIPDAQAYGYSFQRARVKLKFADGMALIGQAEAEAFGGKIGAKGQYDAKSESYHFTVSAESLSADQFSEFVEGLEGSIRADVAISGQGMDIGRAQVYGSASIAGGSYRGVAFQTVGAGFYKQGGDLTLDYLTAALPRGSIGASGKLSGGKIEMEARGSAIDLAQAAQIDPRLALSGLADFSGRIVGAPDNPAITVDFSAANGALFGQPYEIAEGRVSGDFGEARIERFDMKNGATRHHAEGVVGLSGAREVQLKVDSTMARAEDLIRLALPGEQLTGNVDNTVTIAGTLDDPDVDGQIYLRDGSFRNALLLKEASGAYRRENGQTSLRDFIVSAPNLKVKLSGVLNANEDLDFDIVADEIDMGKLRLNLPYPASGIARFAGKLQGSVSSPAFNGILTADRLNFNGQELEDLDGRVLYRDDALELTSFGFKQGGGLFSLSAGMDLATEKIHGRLSVEQGDLGAILALVNLENQWIGGKLDGTIDLGGSVQAPKVNLVGYMDNGHLKEYPLSHIVLDVGLDGTVVTIREFRAEQGAGRLVAKGDMDLDGPLNIEVAGQDIDAALITHLADSDMDTKGALNFGAQIGGTADQPQANLSVDIQGGGVGAATFDSLYGMFTLDRGIVHVDQLLAQKGEYKASAYGIIPLAALVKSEKENADLKEQMDLKISLDQADLSILPFLTKEVSWAMGPTKGGVTIGGTLARPLARGEIRVDDGTIKFDALGKPVEHMSLNIQFLDDALELRTFEGQMGEGSFKMTGTGKITGAGLADYDFALRLNQLQIANKYYTGPLQGELALTTEKTARFVMPKLSGRMAFENCTIDIPPIPESEEEMPRVKLDLDVTVGKKVRLYNSFLYDIWLEGHANFGGTTRRPQTSGEIYATRGTVSYLKTPFKIKEATAYFNQVESFLPSLNLEAETRLDRTRVNLKVTGPADQMKIQLTSDPEMNEAELLSLLTLRSHYRDKDGDGGLGRDELVALLDMGLQMSFLSEVESVMRSALGVDEFKVVRDTLAFSGTESARNMDREVYNIEIGKYVSDKLLLKYTTGLDHDSYKFGVRYDFNSKISLTTDIDQDNKSSIGLEARFKF